MQNSKHHEVISFSKSYFEAFQLFRSHVTKIALTSFIPSALVFLLLISLNATFAAAVLELEELTSGFFSFNNSFFIVGMLILLSVILIESIGIIALAYIVVHREDSSVFDAFEHSFAYIWKFLLMVIAVILAAAVGLILGYIVVAIVGPILALFSIELLNDTFIWLNLIPAALSSIFSTFFVFSGYIILEKEYSTKAALRRSYDLVRGHFWPIAFRLLLFYSVIYVLTLVFSLIPFAGNIISILTLTPFSVVYLYILYKDLDRLKKLA